MWNVLHLLNFMLTAFVQAPLPPPVLSWQPDSLILADDDSAVFYQFDVSTRNVDISTYAELPNGYNWTKAIAYDTSTKTLFWSGTNTNREDMPTFILSTVNNSGVVNSLHQTRSGNVYGIAVDSGRQSLFFTTGWDENSVGVMSTNGQNYRNLGKVNGLCHMSPSGITLDTQHRMVYVACYYRLLKMTYNGGGKETIRSGGRMWSVFFHQPTGSLYYNDQRYLYSTNPTNSDRYQSMDKYLEKAPVCVTRYEDRVFVSYMEFDDIHIFNVNGGRKRTIRNIPTDHYHWWSLAYIPPDGQ